MKSCRSLYVACVAACLALLPVTEGARLSEKTPSYEATAGACLVWSKTDRGTLNMKWTRDASTTGVPEARACFTSAKKVPGFRLQGSSSRQKIDRETGAN